MKLEEKKAKELINRFSSLKMEFWDGENGGYYEERVTEELAISCALICVEELIKEHTWNSPISWNVKQKKYWEQVKQHLK